MRPIARIISFSLATGALLLSGCGLGTMAPGGASIEGAATISGTVHGGQQAVTGATVRLYSAGATGYGTGSTLLATTTSGNGSVSNPGSFSFVKNPVNGTSSGVLNLWACPVTGNPIIYITAVGGNTGAGTNANSAMMAVLGPCSSISSTTPVSINEITTVGSVFALAQYINPGTTAGTMTMGTSATTQGNTGIVNAEAGIVNMVNMTSGSVVPPTAYPANGANGTGNVVVTATAENAKIITIANILGSCINTTGIGGASSNCADLFANALPPLSAAYTSQPAATFTAPVDTIQAAYYMATNPASLGTAPATCSNAGGVAATTMACLFGLNGATAAPFVGGLSAQPSDWTIGVTYTATGACTGAGTVLAPTGGAFILSPFKASVDAGGDLWFISGAPSNAASNLYANFAELSPVGVPLACLGNSSNGRGLTIDPTGNVWASFNGNATAGLLEFPVSGGTPILWPSTVNTVAYTTLTTTSDGSGNIYFTNGSGAGAPLLYFAAPGTTTTPMAATLVGPVAGTTTITPLSTAADSFGHIFVSNTSNSSLYESFPTTQNVGATPLKVTSYGVALDSNNYVYTGTTCCGSLTTTTYKLLQKITPNQTTGIGTLSASAQYLGGLNGVRSVALDGAANVWVGNEYPSIGQVGANPVGNNPVVEIATSGSGTTATFTALSPTPSAATISALSATTCASAVGCSTGGGFIKSDFQEARDLTIDPSGNVWVLNTGSEISTNGTTQTFNYAGTTITQIVGAAVPTITPLSVALAAGKLATKP